MQLSGPIFFFLLKNRKFFLDVLVLFSNFASVNDMSRHIEILLLSNDCVIVPGFGGFMAHYVDARKDGRDGSFLPPMRSIGFNPKVTLNDSLLAQSYVEAYDISYPEAAKRLEQEVETLKQRLAANGSYEFNGIGTVTINEDGNYEFTPCEAGLLTPSLYGLDSFRIKKLEELHLLISKGNDTQQTKQAKPVPLYDSSTGEEVDEERHTARIIAVWRNVAVACIAVTMFILLPSPLVNNAQLAENHIDYRLLNKVMPQEMTTAQPKISKARTATINKKEQTDTQIANGSRSAAVPTSSVAPRARFSIVVASHVTRANAKAYTEDLTSRGFKDVYVYQGAHVKVLIGHYPTREEAMKALNSLNNKDEFSGAWVIDLP